MWTHTRFLYFIKIKYVLYCCFVNFPVDNNVKSLSIKQLMKIFLAFKMNV